MLLLEHFLEFLNTNSLLLLWNKVFHLRASGHGCSVTGPLVLSGYYIGVIGAVLGALLGAAVIAFAYLVSGKLRTPSDMESPYGIPVLAVLVSGEDAKLEQVARGIARLMKERKLTTLAISMADTQEAKTAAAHLREKLEAQCASVRTVPGDAVEFIGEVSEADAVLFVEQVGKSRYRDIESRTEVCRKFCIPSAGCVVIGE